MPPPVEDARETVVVELYGTAKGPREGSAMTGASRIAGANMRRSTTAPTEHPGSGRAQS